MLDGPWDIECCDVRSAGEALLVPMLALVLRLPAPPLPLAALSAVVPISFATTSAGRSRSGAYGGMEAMAVWHPGKARHMKHEWTASMAGGIALVATFPPGDAKYAYSARRENDPFREAAHKLLSV